MTQKKILVEVQIPVIRIKKNGEKRREVISVRRKVSLGAYSKQIFKVN